MSLYDDFEHEPEHFDFPDAYLETESWRTKDGREIKIKDMSDEHIINVVKNFEKRKGILPYMIIDRYNKIIKIRKSEA